MAPTRREGLEDTSASLRESIAAFKKDLDELKRHVPKRKFVLPNPVLYDAVQKAVQELYTEEEKKELRTANEKVFNKYEIALYDDLVPAKEKWADISEHIHDEAWRATAFAWAGGVNQYNEIHRELKYHEDDRKKLHSAKARRDTKTGKLVLDLRAAELEGCDLRCVCFEENNLQCAKLKEAFLDFAKIKRCDAEFVEFGSAHAVGLEFEATRFNGSDFTNANFSGSQGGSIFDGSFVQGIFCGATLSKGGMTECRASHWRACKFKGSDFRAAKFKKDTGMPATHKFHGSAFYGSDWRNCDFGEIVDFRFCSMNMKASGAVFRGCDLRNAIDFLARRDVKPDEAWQYIGLVVEPLKSLRPPAPKAGSMCGGLAVAVTKNILACGADDDDDDDAEDDDGDDDDGDVDDGEGGGMLEGALDSAKYSLLDAAQQRADDELLSLAEQGGATLGAHAVTAGDDLEKMLGKKLASADKKCKVQMDCLLKGLRAQGTALSKCKDAEERKRQAKGFESARAGLAKLLQGKITPAAMQRAEQALKENVTPAAFAKFLSSQLKSKTSYDVAGFWGMATAVMSTNPAKMHSDTKEIQRLVSKFEKLDQPVLNTTWTELTDTWLTLYDDYNRMKTERGKLILEQIFANNVILKAVSVTRQLQEINHFDEPPEDLLRMLKSAKVELKRRVDDYQMAADKELVQMGKIQARQQQLVGGISIFLLSVGTSVGNFASQYFYHRIYEPQGGAH